MTRRALLLAAAGATVAACGGADRRPVPSPAAAFAALERRHDARLGVFGMVSGTEQVVAFRPEERFAYCSTHKALSAAALLRLRGPAALGRTRVAIEPADLVEPSPVCAERVGGRMSLLALCDAAVRFSDNTAANHLLRELGGPAGLERELRGIGDRITRCDREEPDLSSAIPGDTRDTSTARALAHDLRTYVLGDVLESEGRALLAGWLKRNTTGDALIRAAAPDGWVVGDKTGSGSYGTRNDIAILWPPRRAPIVLAVLTRRDQAGPRAVRDDALVAAAARVALTALSPA